MQKVIEILLQNPVLLLFSVLAIGYAIGEIKIGGFNLGISGVLFTGIFFGSLHPDLKLPEFVYILGLTLFVYTVGLSNGPGFYSSMKNKGLKNNFFALSITIFGFIMTLIITKILKLKASISGGIFAGSLTNTPALVGLLDYMNINLPKEELTKIIAEPVIAYSVTYPFGIIGVMLTIYFFERFWKIDYSKEAKNIDIPGITNEKIISQSIEITKQIECNIHDLVNENKWHIVLGRIKSSDHISIITNQTIIKIGNIISIVGDKKHIEQVINYLGKISEEKLELESNDLDFRRIFVSNPSISELHISQLNLPKHFGAIITRIRRGDIDSVANSNSVIELGDRIRVIAPRERMNEVSTFFGDSYKALSEINILTFGFGIAIGLLLGLIPIPMPNGTVFRLGFAGGPLIVGLIFGVLGRTGPFIWNLPYSANLTLRQLGLTLFLAGIGTRAGYSFINTLIHKDGAILFLAGALITLLVSSLTLLIGYKVLKIPMSILIGMLAGIQTQPALLAYACERTKNDLPNIGYTTVYPVITIFKIILVQLLFNIVNSGT
ncbi:MAG: transporter [Candidatus Sericytochromatia bacterium]|nr:transporter [Candidatus Sericytochromatia bacterium]